MAETPRQFTHGDYTVGWICALPKTELVAAGAMLDEEHPVLPAADTQDTNSYLLGRIGTHNVVIACLPAETTGKVSAATVAKDMVRSFKAVRFGLMVGVGGGAPYYGVKDNNDAEGGDREDSDSEEDDLEDTQDIRLGDVVISLHSKSAEAVVQYDFGKSVQGKEFIRTGGKLNKPPNIVLNAVAMLQGQHERRGHTISEQLSKMVSENPLMATKFQCPSSKKDRLFESGVVHVDGKKSCKACCGPLDVNLVKRKDRYNSAPSLHYGTIGSADQVMKDATLRDKWAQKEKIMCFEMEAAGLMDSFPCLVIRGICDYADSHKNKIWQPYAAATAAAYAKELLLVIPGQGVIDLPPIEQTGNKIMQQLGTWRRSEEQEKCLQAFRTTDYETQKNLNPEREAGTCLWCLEDERFRNWRDKSTSCLLWVTADPGCGKSVLSRALVDERLLDSAPNDTTICYFFFKDTSEDQRSLVNALAALFHQLFKSKAGAKVIRHALPAFRENKDKVSQNFEVMWGIVQDIALDSDCGKIIFLLDALDECQSSEQQSLITKLKWLEQRQAHLRTVKNFKFLITSRPYWNIEKGFDSLISDIPGIRLKGENQSDGLRSEIDRVIRARVARLGYQIASRKARDQLLEGLLKVENRTYLWLHLIFDLIASKPRIDTKMVKSLLQDLPITVEAAYDAILQKSNDQGQAKRLLHIVVAAVRPLSVNEVGVALYITEETRTYEDLELQEGGQLEVTIRDLCGLFVSIVEKKVYLIHQTAKEFLIADNDLSSSTLASCRIWKHSLFIQDSNLLFAYICIWFSRLEEFHRKSSFLKREEIDQLISRYDFLEYSAMNWAVHFRAATIPEGHSLIASGLELCDVQADRYMSWELVYWQRAGYGSPPAGLNNLHLASRLGLKRVVSQLLAVRDIDVNAAYKYGETSLSQAAAGGHEAVVGQLLAAPGIDVNAAYSKFGETPLWQAAYRGHGAVVGQLLAAPGIDVNATDSMFGETPLSRAAAGGHEAVVGQLLAAPGINVNAAYSKFGGTPLWQAAAGGHEAVVSQLLAAPGIDVNAVYKTKGTPLSQAAAGGHEAVVGQLLAAPSIDVNAAYSKFGETPLWQAAAGGHEAVVGQLLAVRGTDVHAANWFGETPLREAATGGHEVVVGQLLATPGIDVNVRDINGWTPLSQAASRGHKTVVGQLLAVRGIDVNAVDDEYNVTPLWLAASEGHEAVVGQLLATPGIDVNAADKHGRTPLWQAAAGGHEAVVGQLLTAPGIDVNAADNYSQTPLLAAQDYGYASIAKLLEII
ncbi:hypothetical protein ACEPPN_000421 [Leptodophora sp. 'Broadleaf-Isolate-01']